MQPGSERASKATVPVVLVLLVSLCYRPATQPEGRIKSISLGGRMQ